MCLSHCHFYDYYHYYHLYHSIKLPLLLHPDIRFDLAALLSNVLKLHGGVAVPWKSGSSDISEEENEEEEKKRNALLDEEVARLTSSSSLAVPVPLKAPPR
jgi:hypothetical protein